MKNLQGKVAAITGAGSGIGQALALFLAKQGCHLALSDINQEGLDDTQTKLSSYSIKVTRQILNVADEQAVFAWADQVEKDHGKVNLIFNNAGVALSGTVSGLSLDEYRWIMDINFWGVVYGTKAFLPKLEASGDGHVVNISSIFGLTSQPLMSGYNASKFAIRGFTESLRQDLELIGSKVSATCVHPGCVKTNIAQAARISASVKESIGVDNEDTVKDFERLFISTPESTARTIVNGVLKNKRRILTGPDAIVFDLIVRLMPSTYQWLFTNAVKWRAKKTRGINSESP